MTMALLISVACSGRLDNVPRFDASPGAIERRKDGCGQANHVERSACKLDAYVRVNLY